jgi:hypothetical protein
MSLTTTIDVDDAGIGQQATGALPFPDGATFRGVLPDFIVCLCTLTIEGSITLLAMLGRLGVLHALSAHLALVCLLSAWLISRLHRDEGIRIATLLLLSTATMGALGPLGTLLVLGLSKLNQRSTVPFERWYMSLFPEIKHEPARDLYHRLVYGRGADAASSVAAFSDVMSLGTVAQKQAALTLIADHFRPSYAPALRRALNDRESAVRVQAATAVARIENGFLERSMQLEAWAARPNAGVEARLALARHLDEQANTGLLDIRRARETRERALALFRAAVDERADDLELAKTCGRLMLRLDRSAAAAEFLAGIVERFAFAPAVFVWYLEALYRLGRLEEVRALCRDHGFVMRDAPEISDEMRMAIAMWVDPEAYSDSMRGDDAAA